MLMVIVSIAVLGLSFFIIENSRNLLVKESLLKSLYLAEAGVQEAVYLHKKQRYFSLGERANPVNPGETYNLSGDEAGLLMVDTRVTNILKLVNRYWVRQTYLRSAVDSDLTLTQMIITWSNTDRLKRIRLRLKTLWNGNANSPFVYNGNNAIPYQRQNLVLIFKKGDPATVGPVSIKFSMSDGSSKELEVYPASQQFNFTVESQGSAELEEDLPPFTTTIEAEYNAATSQIVDYKKIQ